MSHSGLHPLLLRSNQLNPITAAALQFCDVRHIRLSCTYWQQFADRRFRFRSASRSAKMADVLRTSGRRRLSLLARLHIIMAIFTSGWHPLVVRGNTIKRRMYSWVYVVFCLLKNVQISWLNYFSRIFSSNNAHNSTMSIIVHGIWCRCG